MSAVEQAEVPIPEHIKDSSANRSYTRGKYFVKGGFAKCYELIDDITKGTFAGKIVPKTLLVKSNQKEKMVQEIQIHSGLSHKHIVEFHGFFEDSNFVYVILELCRKRSMMELHKRRKALTEPEVRYYMKQIFDGVLYLHERNIIHRDLKLGNLFLNDRLEVKIGDFGLAAKIEYSGQRKRTLCGTPNYIAPEILTKKGHSFEVDIWSLGCIMYTLLVGKPPFETHSLRETYARIKKCEYHLPQHLNPAAAHMVHEMLQPEPTKRPTVKQLLEMEFLCQGYCPRELPQSCLTMAPRFDQFKDSVPFRKPLIEVQGDKNRIAGSEQIKKDNRQSVFGSSSGPVVTPCLTASNCNRYLQQLRAQLAEVVQSPTHLILESDAEEITDPAAQPFLWISKWVDYSDKYGFGYQLCDDGVGVRFNDCTKIVLLANQRNIHYIDKDGTEHYYLMGETPPSLEKKMKLLSYFRRYMSEHLMKAGASVQVQESDSLSRFPYLNMWHRSSSAVIMQLTNGTVQINFVDHTKIIMCPLMAAVTYIDGSKNFLTYRFSTIAKHGCVRGLAANLDYAYDKITYLLQNSNSLTDKVM